MTTLIREEAERGLAGMDPGRRSRYLARMSMDDLTARHDLAERDGDTGTMAILEEAIREHYARQAAEAAHAERAAHWRENTLQGQAHTDAEREWWAAAQNEYERAEAKCNVLLSPAGREECESAFPALWYATPAELDVWISDDLRHWLEHGELSITSWDEWRRHALWAEDRSHPRHEVREAGMEETATAPGAAPEPNTREWRLAQGHSEATVDAAERMKAASARRLAGGIAPGPAAGAAEAGERARAALATPAAEIPAALGGDGAGALAVPDEGAGRVVSAPAFISHPEAAAILGDTLDRTARYLRDHVQFKSRSQTVAVTGWLAQATAKDADNEPLWLAFPRLLLTSRLNGSGKSTLADMCRLVLGGTGGRASKVTPYGLCLMWNKRKEAAIADDAQNVFRSDKAGAELLTVLINGYTRGATWVNGKSGDGEVHRACGQAVIVGKDALITARYDYLKDLIDRSAPVIRLERPKRYMPILNRSAMARGTAIGQVLTAATAALANELRRAEEDLGNARAGELITDGDGGRRAQVWAPLEAVARIAGGPWPDAMAQAREELAGDGTDLLSVSEALAAAEEAAGVAGGSFWDEEG